MRSRHILLILGAVAAGAGGSGVHAKPAEPSHVFGPPPTWESFRAIAEQSIQAKLLDPDSARISWSGGFYPGYYRAILGPRVDGYVACGRVNGRNRFGGYAGSRAFVVVVDYGRVLYSAIADADFDLIGAQCAKAIEKGLIPALPDTGAVLGPKPSIETGVTTSSGLALKAMPEGAYVSGVDANSTAAAAGIKPGMLITEVNGIALGGLGEAMLKVVASVPVGTTLKFAGGNAIRLGDAR